MSKNPCVKVAIKIKVLPDEGLILASLTSFLGNRPSNGFNFGAATLLPFSILVT